MNIVENKTILLVEDEALIAMTKIKELENYGYVVYHVSTGEKAVEVILENAIPIDLILMDIDLGSGIDGTKAAEQILDKKDIPVVFLSSHFEPEIVEKTERITSYGYVIKSSIITVLDISIKMALKLFNSKKEQKRADEALQRSEALLRTIAENYPNSYVSIIEEDLTIGFTSGREFKKNNLDPSQFIGLTLDQVFGEHAQFVKEHYLKSFEGSEEQFELFINNQYQLYRTVPLIDSTGKIKRILSVVENITERKLMENTLAENEENFRYIFDSSVVGISITSLTGETKVNQAICNMLGYSMEEYGNRKWQEITHPEDIELSYKMIQTLLSGEKEVVNFVKRFFHKNGSIVWAELDSKLRLNQDSKPRYILTMIRDITERKWSEGVIKRQLTEKEILLKEVHHRVKNNISSIEALLSLQAISTNNPEIETALKEAVSRIQSMRILYDKLLLSQNYHDVSIKNYVEGIIDSLLEVFVKTKNITIEIQITDFKILPNKAINIGIIINELMTNVFKYAFKELDNGKVLISINKNENKVSMIIHDNGIGINENNKSHGFGLRIVKMLVEQLKGTYKTENENGTKNSIEFKI